jgi:hypothetical protein
MTAARPSWEDCFAIQALVARYVWDLDMGDVPAVMTHFTADAVFQDTAGNVHDGAAAIEAYYRGLVVRPEFRGRQHHIDHMLWDRAADGYLTRSYWTVTKWRSGTGEKVFEVVGHSLDRFVRRAGVWRFAERRVYYWKDDDCPWNPPKD